MAVSISLARAGGAGGSQSAVRERTARRWAQLLRERLGTADGAAQLLRGRPGIADGGGAAPQRFVVSRMKRRPNLHRHERYPPSRTTAVAVPLVRRFSLAPRAAAGLRLIRPFRARQTAQPRCELTHRNHQPLPVRRRLPREPGAAGVHRGLAQLSQDLHSYAHQIRDQEQQGQGSGLSLPPALGARLASQRRCAALGLPHGYAAGQV